MGTPNEGINGTLATGLIAHWDFTDGRLLDVSGNGRHLAQATANLVKFSNDKDGNANSCALIDSDSSWLSTPFSENIASPTISCWVKTNGNYGALVFIRGSGGLSAGFGIQHYTPFGYFSIQTVVSGTGEITPGNIAGNNNWQHVVATYDKINGLLKIYVDKVLALIKSVSTAGITYSSDVDIKIGHNNYGNFKGYLDEVRVYDRVLSDGGLTTVGQTATGEVAELYTMGVNYATPTNPPVFNVINTSIDNKVVLNILCDKDATAWYKLYSRNATAPTSAQLKSTHDGEIDLLGLVNKSTNIYLWKGETNYDLYIVAEDGFGNIQTEPTKLQFTSPLLFLATYPPRANKRYDVKLNEFFTNVGTQLGLTLTLPAFNDNNWDVTILTALSVIESNLKTQLDKPKRDDKNYDVKLNRCLSKIINVINGAE